MDDKPIFKIAANSNKDIQLSLVTFERKIVDKFDKDSFIWIVKADGKDHKIFASGHLNEMFEIAKGAIGNDMVWKFVKTNDETMHLFNNMNRKQLLAHQLNNADKQLPGAAQSSGNAQGGDNVKDEIVGALKSIEENVAYIMGKLSNTNNGVSDKDLPF